MSTYVTDEALTAQTVEMPCTPPYSGFSYTGCGFRFAVDVTERAKLGPEAISTSNVKFDHSLKPSEELDVHLKRCVIQWQSLS